jgi:hypothetical protein
MPPVGFEPTIPAKRSAADLLLRPRGDWDRPDMRKLCAKMETPRKEDLGRMV